MTTVPLREYFERLFIEHEKTHVRDHEATLRALGEAREHIEQRLQALNELRAEVTEDRGQLVQRTTFDAKTEAQDKELRLLRDDTAAIRAELANQRGRQAAYAAVLAIGLVVVPFVISRL